MTELCELLDPLRRLHDWVRSLILAACHERSASDLARVTRDGAGDVTFMVDEVSESALLEFLADEIACHGPIVVVGEGLPDGRVTLPAAADPADAAWRIIVDPIDGTRGLVYQKRPGWILTGVAPNRGDDTSLADVELALQTEIPLVKQHLSDQLWAIRGQGAQGRRINRLTGRSERIELQASTATDLRDGFATICRFFPGGRDVLAALDDDLCARLVGSRRPGDAAVSNDQYACTGGQIYGLVMGQDRLVADLRPLVAPIVTTRGGVPGHCCHPYDVCTAMIAEEAGVVVTDATGNPLDAPLDTGTDIAWIGYANRDLQASIAPVLGELLREHGLVDAISLGVA